MNVKQLEKDVMEVIHNNKVTMDYDVVEQAIIKIFRDATCEHNNKKIINLIVSGNNTRKTTCKDCGFVIDHVIVDPWEDIEKGDN